MLFFHVRPATQSTLARVAFQVGRTRDKGRCAVSQCVKRPGDKNSGSGLHSIAEDVSSLVEYDAM